MSGVESDGKWNLAPCPHCGSVTEFRYDEDVLVEDEGNGRVCCADATCRAQSIVLYWTNAEEWWNRRTGTTEGRVQEAPGCDHDPFSINCTVHRMVELGGRKFTRCDVCKYENPAFVPPPADQWNEAELEAMRRSQTPPTRLNTTNFNRPKRSNDEAV